MSYTRSAISTTISVWKALFLREAVSRISNGRAAWIWLLLEPLAHMFFLLFMFTVIRLKSIAGIETSVWLIMGLTAFFMFRRTATQAKSAVSANVGLFSYRQVKPVDTVLVRGALDGFLSMLITLILLGGAAFFGVNVLPEDPLLIFEAFIGLWLVGMGFGLIASVASELIPELGMIFDFTMMPLYFMSGVIFSLTAVPPPYHDWLMLNPLAHGVDAARLGFSSTYHAAPELSMGYLYSCALVSIFIGLLLQNRFAGRLLAK